MKPDLIYLLLASSFCLVVLTISGFLLIRDQRRVAQQTARIDGLASAYQIRRGEAASDGQLVRLKLQRVTLTSRAARLIRYNINHKAIYPLPPFVILALAVVPAAIAGRVVVSFTGSVGWAVVPVLCMLACRGFYGWLEDRLLAGLYRQFPDALATIVRAVRVGLPMVEAIRIVAAENPEPTRREFAALVGQTGIGVPLENALRDMAERSGLHEYRFFATALSLQSQTGGGLTETLENLADTIRKRLAVKLKGHALGAEARMSAYILGAVPLVVGALLLITNSDYMAVFFTDSGGRKLLLAAAALLAVGGFSMRAMIRMSLA